MAKIAVVLLADTDRPESMSRMANALPTATEAKEAGDEIRVILEGDGTKWGAELADESHKYHRLRRDLKAETGACAYWSRAFGVKDQLEGTGIAFLNKDKGHPSVRQLIVDGFVASTSKRGCGARRAGRGPRCDARSQAPDPLAGSAWPAVRGCGRARPPGGHPRPEH